MLEVGDGEATLIDESYNANPASMSGALDVLGQAPVGPHGRRIAMLGDMLELGPTGPALHRGLIEAVRANQIDLIYCCGPLMRICGTLFPPASGEAMPRTRLPWKPRPWPPSGPAMPSW